jgi:outer membrane biosynthesis protein TonB
MTKQKEILALTATLLALVVSELNAAPAPEPEADPEPTPEPVKTAKGKTKPAPEPEADPEPTPEPESEEITLATLREVASSLLTEGRKPEVVKVLAKFKTAALKDLDPKHYPAVHAALSALIA